MNKKLPYEDRQKFQIGDICKIVHTDNGLRFPKITDEKDINYGRECIILHTYSQVFWGSNYNDYSVYLLPIKNTDAYSGSFAWVSASQMEFIRKPNDEEIAIVVEEDISHLKVCRNYKSIFKGE